MSTVSYPHISIDDDGTARISQTRYKVLHLAAEHYHHGWSAEELLRQHPDLQATNQDTHGFSRQTKRQTKTPTEQTKTLTIFRIGRVGGGAVEWNWADRGASEGKIGPIGGPRGGLRAERERRAGGNSLN